MDECTFIILGASGDLAKRMLFPALYQLIAKNIITKFIIVGASRDAVVPDALLKACKPYIPDVDETVLAKMRKHLYYQQLDFQQESDFAALQSYCAALEKEHKLAGNRVIYCAAAAQFYCPITKNLALSALAKKKNSDSKQWHRIVYEKPFGHDLASAHSINECIAHYFDESQIYRIDHYLTKELVSNIALLRFTNCVFEPLWNNRYIDQVQIVLSESIGLEGRGAYYDAYGALSDVMQNHMLELLALIGMEAPERLTGEYIRIARAKVLEKVTVVDALLGQFDGYKQEPQVRADSTTETFALAHLRINNPRWAGVPFYLKTGKCLDKKETVVHIKFKQVDCLLAKNCPSDSNYLTIQVAPEASFALSLNAKKPGVANEVTPIKMEFSHSSTFGVKVPTAHEVIFQEIVRGEQSVAVRFDEIESAWKIIDAIKAKRLSVYNYACGSGGPVQIEQFVKKHGMRWKS